jgi:hypothetical protein
VEERSGFRRPTIKSASSLSSLANRPFQLRGCSRGGRSGSGDARFEGEYQSMSSALCASAPSHPLHAMPPRFTRNSDRPRASDRTMVDTKNTRDSLANFSRHDWRRHHRQMNPTGMANKPEPKPLARTERHSYRQWAGCREKIFSPPVEAELFFLTSLFIELIDSRLRLFSAYFRRREGAFCRPYTPPPHPLDGVLYTDGKMLPPPARRARKTMMFAPLKLQLSGQ